MNINKLTQKIALIGLLFFTNKSIAQLGVNATNAAPNAKAMLDVESTDKGILIPRMVTTSRDAIASPPNGLMIYNTSTNKFNYFDGAAWQETFFGNQWNVNGTNISYSGGNVGIGTTTPAAQMNIYDNSSPRIQFNSASSGISVNDGLYIGNNNVNKGFVWNLENAGLGFATNNAEQMTILASGNVGIGNQNPSQKLNVNGNVIAQTLSLNTTNAAPNANAILDMISTTKGILIPRMTTVQRNAIPITAGLMVYDTDTDGFWFHNGVGWFDVNSSWDRDETVVYSNSKNLSTVIGIGLTPLPTSTSPATPGGSVTNGRLQIVGSNNSDNLTIRHPSSPILRWGFYVSAIDSSLNFYYNGSLRANIDRVTGVYSALSDRRLKKNIASLNPVLNKILSLNAYNYNMLDSEDNGRKSIGFMAQDVQPLFPELVHQNRDRETNEPFLMMDYSSFGVIAIKAIQEQQTIIDGLQSQIDELKKLIGALKK
jgi:Chaperone of endosialidase